MLGSSLVVAGPTAGDLYVSLGGDDSNPGTSIDPLRSITRAYTLAGAGVTIHVLPGVYTDFTSGWGLRLVKSGTASAPIVLKSEVRGAAVIDGQNNPDRNEGLYIEGSYHVVDGFGIRNCPKGGIAIYGNGNRILNNEIYDNGNADTASSNGQDGVYSNQGTQDNDYAANSIHDNGRPGNNLDHGLYLCGQNEMVINNLLFRNPGSGLQVAGYTTVSNMKVYNNVMAWNGTSGIILWMALSGVALKNNIIYQNGHAGIAAYAATGSGVVMDHNLIYGNGSGSYDLTGGDSAFSYILGTTISGPPGFLDDSFRGFDAHLGAGSPALQAGVNFYPVFTTDIIGAAQPASGAWDLGAYSSNLSFPARSGTITAPFYVGDTTIVQPEFTGVGDGGQAVYAFNLTAPGYYLVSALVTAPSLDNNSFFVNIDAQPSDPLMIWDLPLALTPTIESVAWRGTGALDPASPSGFDSQYAPRMFPLSAGTHELIVRGREGNCALGTIAIVPANVPGWSP